MVCAHGPTSRETPSLPRRGTVVAKTGAECNDAGGTLVEPDRITTPSFGKEITVKATVELPNIYSGKPRE